MITLDKVMPKVALPIIIFAGLLLVFMMLSRGQTTNDQNNAYIRVINCIVSHNASTRTQEDIESCYIRVERDLRTTLQRYDSSDNQ